MLAVVVPDSILTNSSLQYVRDGLEEMYRIVAVVSMPQTAFAATGAGVKSSVLILKKWSAAKTKEIRDLKQKLKDLIRREENFEAQLLSIEKRKKAELKAPPFFDFEEEPSPKELKETPQHKAWAKQVSDKYAAQVEALRFRLSEEYEAKRREQLPDYKIFMAIADSIGYDAVGKDTKTNDFPFITKELARFIEKIEEGTA